MSQARIYFVKLNLDDFAATVAGLDSDLEYRQFVDGFLVGARGFEARDTWSEAKINGHAIGDGCFKDAQRFSASQREKVMHRYQVETTELPRNYHGSTSELPENYLTNNQQLIATNDKKEPATPLAPPVIRKRRSANGSSLDVIKHDGDRGIFQTLWEEWPRERDGKPARGEKPKAQTCFQSILDGGEVSAEELLQAARVYISEDGRVKAGYPKMVSSWLALKDGFWKQCVQTVRARSMEAM